MSTRSIGSSRSAPMYRPTAPAPSHYRYGPSIARVDAGAVLKLGQRGPAVRRLQKQINAAGAQPPLDVDGKMGPKTEAACRAFQAKNGLDVDGLAGPQTHAALRNGATFEGAAQGQARDSARDQVGAQAPAHPAQHKPESRRQVQAKPGLQNTQNNQLQSLLKDNPQIKTNQDFINHCYQNGGNDWKGASQVAARYGQDLNQLVRHRSAAIDPGQSAATSEKPAANPAADPAVQTGGTAATGGAETGQVPGGTLKKVFLHNRERAGQAKMKPTAYQKRELRSFQKLYAANKDRYERVAQKTGVPAKLIAAIHYRESSGNFNTYLHQGDPLGKPAVHVPRNIPVFHNWEDAAVHALKQKRSTRDALGMTAQSSDPATLGTFAERYNGLGYHNKGLASPYVWSGTDAYTGGMYVADHKFSRTAKDRRPGVIALMNAIKDQ